ncbi:MAG: hypothetical protein NW224_12820 [Leptolyngbyaceae cyanobacterium bins.302]|nr:hypothetical protein [Leptolyngbyaceae cyanobacterium bins.302]
MSKSANDTGGSNPHGYRFLVRPLPEFEWITEYLKHRPEFRCMSDGVEAALRSCYLWRSLLWRTQTQPEPAMRDQLEQELIRAYYGYLGDLALIEREMQRLGLHVPARVRDTALPASPEGRSMTDRSADSEPIATEARSQDRKTAIAQQPLIDQGLLSQFGSLGIGVNLMHSDETREEDKDVRE